jgi:hypothetical protein
VTILLASLGTEKNNGEGKGEEKERRWEGRKEERKE